MVHQHLLEQLMEQSIKLLKQLNELATAINYVLQEEIKKRAEDGGPKV